MEITPIWFSNYSSTRFLVGRWIRLRWITDGNRYFERMDWYSITSILPQSWCLFWKHAAPKKLHDGRTTILYYWNAIFFFLQNTFFVFLSFFNFFYFLTPNTKLPDFVLRFIFISSDLFYLPFYFPVWAIRALHNLLSFVSKRTFYDPLVFVLISIRTKYEARLKSS